MKIIEFTCDDNLKQYTDSMLFDSGTVVASLDCEVNDHRIEIFLEVRGEVKIDYKGSRYRYPSDFPSELKEQIKTNPFWFTDTEDLEIDMNNWFEYIYDDTVGGKTYSDGIMCEIDFSNYTEEEMKNKLIEIAYLILE